MMTDEALRKYAKRKQIEIYDEILQGFVPEDKKEKKAFALRFQDGSMAIMIAKSQDRDGLSEKELLAHELGHCMMNAFPGNGHSEEECEEIANAWAYKRCVPERELRRQCEPLVNEIQGEIRPEDAYRIAQALSSYFEVSSDFIIGAMTYYGGQIDKK
jgi:Zn-dependent peptidase ImmA (M78 family)